MGKPNGPATSTWVAGPLVYALGVRCESGPPCATTTQLADKDPGGDVMAKKDKRTALEKLPSRIEEGRRVWSVPIPEPKSKVRAVRKPYKLKPR